MNSQIHKPLSALYGLTVAEDMPEVFARHWDAFGMKLKVATWHADPDLVPSIGWRHLVAEWVAADSGGSMRRILRLLHNLDPASRHMMALYSATPEPPGGLRRRWIGPGLMVFLGGSTQMEGREGMLIGLIEASLAKHRPLLVSVETNKQDSKHCLSVLILPFATLQSRAGAIVLGSPA